MMIATTKFPEHIILLFTFFLTTSISAQNTLISKNDIKINGIKMFELNMESLLENFGEPESIENFFFEMDNAFAKKVTYDDGLVVFFLNDKFDSFELTSQRYTFLDQEIRVFQYFSRFLEYFPESYANKKESSLSLTLKEYDKYITFFFDEDDKISMIRMGDY